MALHFRTVFFSLLMMLALPVSGWGIGFRNPDQGARATGQGEAFVAQADDASAIYYNPAGLTQVKGTQITFGSYFNAPSIQFTGMGGTYEPRDRTTVLPHLYAASDFGTEKWRLGLGINAPFGSDIEWPADSSFRFTALKSDLTVVNFAPTIAYQASPWLSVGGGLNYFRGDTSLEWALPPAVPPMMLPMEARFQLDAKGDALGFTAGALVKTGRHSVGLNYRSPVELCLDREGTARVFFPPGADLAGAEIETRLDLPQSLVVGYAFRPVERLKVEFDVEWTNWETLETAALRSANPLFDGQQIAFRWQDSLFYEFGAEYKIDAWVVRGGYIFSENTVPDSSFSPSIPDADRHVVSVGAGFQVGPAVVDAAYQRSISRDRAISASAVFDPGLAGRWESTANAAILTLTLKF